MLKNNLLRNPPTGPKAWLIVTVSVLPVLLSGCGGNQSALNPKGPAAARLALLGWIMIAIAAVVCLVVIAMIIIPFYRSRRGESQPESDERYGRRFILIGGIIVPLVVLVPLMALVIYIDRSLAAPPAEPQVVVEVVGHQWWWEIRYPDQEVITANEIHIPAGVPVSVWVVSDDVIHSFWIPQLTDKIDLFPGQVNTIWLQADEAGVYRGQCAEYCGLQHANMAFLVVAEPVDQFTAWLERQSQPAPEPLDPLVQKGQQVFLGSACVYCHAIKGTNASGDLGPDLTHLASRRTIGAGILTNTRGNLAGWIVNAQDIKPGNRMPPMYLNGADLQALLEYLETLE